MASRTTTSRTQQVFANAVNNHPVYGGRSSGEEYSLDKVNLAVKDAQNFYLDNNNEYQQEYSKLLPSQQHKIVAKLLYDRRSNANNNSPTTGVSATTTVTENNTKHTNTKLCRHMHQQETASSDVSVQTNNDGGAIVKTNNNANEPSPPSIHIQYPPLSTSSKTIPTNNTKADTLSTVGDFTNNEIQLEYFANINDAASTSNDSSKSLSSGLWRDSGAAKYKSAAVSGSSKNESRKQKGRATPPCMGTRSSSRTIDENNINGTASPDKKDAVVPQPSKVFSPHQSTTQTSRSSIPKSSLNFDSVESFDTATIKDNDTCEDRVLLNDKDEKKKSTATASDIGGGERITRGRATISNTPQCEQLSTTSTHYTTSQDNIISNESTPVVVSITLPNLGPLGLGLSSRDGGRALIIDDVTPQSQAEKFGMLVGDVPVYKSTNIKISYSNFILNAQSTARPLMFDVLRNSSKLLNSSVAKRVVEDKLPSIMPQKEYLKRSREKKILVSPQKKKKVGIDGADNTLETRGNGCSLSFGTSSDALVTWRKKKAGNTNRKRKKLQHAIGGRGKSRRFRVKKSGAGGKRNVQKNLFSPPATHASTIDSDNDMLGRGRGRRKRKERDYKEDNDDESVNSVVSTDSGGMKTRALLLAGTKLGSECAKESKKRQKMDDNVPKLPNEKELEDTNIDVGDASTIQSVIQQARTHLVAGRIEEALKLYHETVKSLPKGKAEVFTLINGITRCWIDSTKKGKDLNTNDLSFLRTLLELTVSQPIINGSITVGHQLLLFVNKLYLDILAGLEVTDESVAIALSLKTEVESINQKVQVSNLVQPKRKEACEKLASVARELVEDVMCQCSPSSEDDDADGEWKGDGEYSEDETDDTLEEEELPTRNTRSTSSSRKKKKKKKKKNNNNNNNKK